MQWIKGVYNMSVVYYPAFAVTKYITITRVPPMNCSHEPGAGCRKLSPGLCPGSPSRRSSSEVNPLGSHLVFNSCNDVRVIKDEMADLARRRRAYRFEAKY